MRATLIIGALAATVGVGSAAYMLLAEDEPEAERKSERRPGKAARASERGAPPAEDRSDWATEDRVAELEAEVASLQRQVRALQLRAGAGAGMAASDEPLDVDDPELEQSLRAIVAEEREREREQELERRRTRAQERTEQALDELVAQANIDAGQREKIGTLWTEERDRMFSLFSEARSGEGNFREVREQARQMRETTDEQAKALLSDEQYEVYSQLRPRGPGGRGGRSERGEGGGRGPRGGRPEPPDGP